MVILVQHSFHVISDLTSWIGALKRHPQTKTPNIDALAQRGYLFINAYCSAPYCNGLRPPEWCKSERPSSEPAQAARGVSIYVAPAGKRGVRVTEPLSLIDIHPGVLTAAALDPESRDAFDLAPMMTSEGKAHRPYSPITAWQEGNHSIRTKTCRFTSCVGGGSELLDNTADPREWTNLANRSEYNSVWEELSALINARCGQRQRNETT